MVLDEEDQKSKKRLKRVNSKTFKNLDLLSAFKFVGHGIEYVVINSRIPYVVTVGRQIKILQNYESILRALIQETFFANQSFYSDVEY